MAATHPLAKVRVGGPVMGRWAGYEPAGRQVLLFTVRGRDRATRGRMSPTPRPGRLGHLPEQTGRPAGRRKNRVRPSPPEPSSPSLGRRRASWGCVEAAIPGRLPARDGLSGR